MRIDSEEQGDIVVLALGGRFDASATDQFRQRTRELIEAGQARIVVDFTEVVFVDSSALGALVATLRSANRAGGDIRISGPRPEVRGIFELTRLNKLFDIHEQRMAAVAAFHG